MRYEQQAEQAIRSKDTEISELHSEMFTLTEEHSTLVTQVTHEKEKLIEQNKELKQQLSAAKLEAEMLRSDVERYHSNA